MKCVVNVKAKWSVFSCKKLSFRWNEKQWPWKPDFYDGNKTAAAPAWSAAVVGGTTFIWHSTNIRTIQLTRWKCAWCLFNRFTQWNYHAKTCLNLLLLTQYIVYYGEWRCNLVALSWCCPALADELKRLKPSLPDTHRPLQLQNKGQSAFVWDGKAE